MVTTAPLYLLISNANANWCFSVPTKYLLYGSVVTLLVAIPTHILARHRNYCCAGFYTFIGITFGIAVMLLSFGPGIFFLYVERWKKLHPEKRIQESEDRNKY